MLYVETEGCGREGCTACRNSKEAFARIKGWNDAKEEAKMSGLAETLKTESLRTVVTQIDGYFDGQIKAKQQEVDKLNAEINSERIRQLREKRNAIVREIDELKTAQKTVNSSIEKVLPTKRGDFYYISSRTGDSTGHYIELIGDVAKCKTCPSGIYNGWCWASREIETKPGRAWYNYRLANYTPEKFDQSVESSKAKTLANR